MFKTRIKTKKDLVLEFNQSQWLKRYVKYNSKKEKNQKNNFNKDEKALLKLINSAVYNKTMENVRNRINARLVSNKKDYLIWT